MKILTFLMMLILTVNFAQANQKIQCNFFENNENAFTASLFEEKGLQQIVIQNVDLSKKMAALRRQDLNPSDFTEYKFRTDVRWNRLVDPKECRNVFCQTWYAIRYIPFGEHSWFGNNVLWVALQNRGRELADYQIEIDYEYEKQQNDESFRLQFLVQFDDYYSVPIYEKMICYKI